jgi:hypothetical protein
MYTMIYNIIKEYVLLDFTNFSTKEKFASIRIQVILTKADNT